MNVRFPIRFYRKFLYWVDNDDAKQYYANGVTSRFRTDTYATWESVRSLFRDEYEVLSYVLDALDDESVFWDVGANVGLYSCFAGQISATVAFEPDPDVLDVLRDNVDLNDVDVTPVNKALGDTNGIERFKGDERFGTRWATAIQSTADRAVEDGYPTPDVVKVDVEGQELEVLAGARDALSETREIVVEVHPNYGVDVDEVIESLYELGFSTFWISEKHLVGTK